MKNSTSIKVPKKYEKMLAEVYHDSDGYWAYSEDSYCFSLMNCHTAHEDTQNKLLTVIRSLEPCDCEECKKKKRTIMNDKTYQNLITDEKVIASRYYYEFCLEAHKDSKGDTCHPKELTKEELIKGGIELLKNDDDYIELD